VIAAPAIAVEGLVKRYAGRTVVDGVSLEVAPGELVALLGPNGAGKTTTVETIEGYRRPDGGSVRVLGLDPVAGGRALRARVGLMLQGGGIDPRARPRETLVEYARYHHGSRDADGLLELVGLSGVAQSPFRQLSGGERQRLSLALALVGQPDVLVLDEPTAGMDPEARLVTRRIVADARAGGAAILLTSHDLTDVERLADRIVVIDAGRVVAAGSPAELIARAGSGIRFRLERPLDGTAFALVAGRLAAVHAAAGLVADDGEGRYRVDGLEPGSAVVAAAVTAIAAGCAETGRVIVELRTGGGSLEEAYLALVGEARGTRSVVP
jgi:ABC-2 type transport system ATP-binding protein